MTEEEKREAETERLYIYFFLIAIAVVVFSILSFICFRLLKAKQKQQNDEAKVKPKEENSFDVHILQRIDSVKLAKPVLITDEDDKLKRATIAKEMEEEERGKDVEYAANLRKLQN